MPPHLAERLLQLFLRTDLAEEVLGDLEEKFFLETEKKSAFRAKVNYWYQVLNYLRPFALKKSKIQKLNHYVMYKNYFKIGYRNLLRNKWYSAINIGGLAVGMAVAILIGMWIKDELSFDKHNENYERIALVMQHFTINGEKLTQYTVPAPLEAELRENYGNDFRHLVLSTWPYEQSISFDQKSISRKGQYMGVDGPMVLSLNMIKGTRNGLKHPNSIMLSKTTSEALFGTQDPIGKVLKINNQLNARVTGVYEDIPKTSTHFSNVKFVAPWELFVLADEEIKESLGRWDANYLMLLAQLEDNVHISDVNERIISAKAKYPELNSSDTEIFLMPMRDWHLRANWEGGIQSGGLIQYVWMLGVVGIFVLILACINFMNLSTANSEKRVKEVGIRKSMGSLRRQLVQQFLSESFITVIFAFVVAGVIVFFATPYFNILSDKQMNIPYDQMSFWLIGICFVLLTGFLAGSYPALYMSSFQPVVALKGRLKAGPSAMIFRKVLVVIQFFVSVGLIIGTIVIEKQVQFSKNRPVGYEQNGVITIHMSSSDFDDKYDLLRDQLTRNQAIADMSESSSPMSEIWNNEGGYSWLGKDSNLYAEFGTIRVMPEYGSTIGWKITEGRDFSRNFSTDSASVIINKSTAKFMGLENPIGQTLTRFEKNYKIIGVVEDILMESPFSSAVKTVYLQNDQNLEWMHIKLNPNKGVSESLKLVEEVFDEILPDSPFDYTFVDLEYAEKFATEEKIGSMSSVFSVLAIFISTLGLLGMSFFVTEQRTKEIGIRKVLGATILILWKLLTKDFVFLVMISWLLAVPVAYFILNSWLNNYEYRIDLSWWIFASAGIGTLVITLLTVSFQTIKVTSMNPVKSLRSE